MLRGWGGFSVVNEGGFVGINALRFGTIESSQNRRLSSIRDLDLLLTLNLLLRYLLMLPIETFAGLLVFKLFNVC